MKSKVRGKEKFKRKKYKDGKKIEAQEYKEREN